ncbi:nocturnin [Aplysia californica]|uniref:Nocturnin n=1 Tax=Aplysia californica TaxID=6500 RepID=A0ABM0JTG0_APLCA|nr:nocturnin [Aplysia californica]XP_005101078.1 nocturnin [Aplysia californica]
MTETKNCQQVLAEIQEQSRTFDGPALLTRRFVTVTNGAATSSQTETAEAPTLEKAEGAVRIMQWNVLAQGLCLCSDSFVLCPPAALDWSRRKNYVMEELLTYDPDIFCLEEVDHFDFISQYLSPLGFQGLFCPKPDSPCLYEENNSGPDGCAVFWRKSHFSLTSYENVVLRDDREKETNQVALLCWLRGLYGSSKGKDILVVATHLKSKKGYSELRYQQGKFLERELMKQAQGKPVVLCGDFNAEPEEKVIQVIKSSKLQLMSTYTLLSPSGAEPEYTTWKVRSGKHGETMEESCHTIDYVFVTRNNSKCVKLLQFPTGAELGDGFLPSFSYPSDHLSLVADLVFT